MQHASVRRHGLSLAAATLASLALVPAAAADDGLPAALDPAALTAAAVAPAAAVDPTALAAAITDAVPLSPPANPSQAVPAAAAEPTTALEPQPTPTGAPPPPQPAEPEPENDAAPPQPAAAPAETPGAPSAPVVEPQYQPGPPQYQPPESDAVPVSAPTDGGTGEWNWDWAWDCAEGTLPDAVSGPPGGAPTIWNWNWEWNCDASTTAPSNSATQTGQQYRDGIARYHPVNVHVSIRIGSPGDNGPVTQTNVIVAVEPTPLVEAVQEPAAAGTAPFAPPPEATAAADAAPPPQADKPAPASDERATSPPAATRSLSSRWTPRHATPPALQPKPQAHRSRPTHRRPTRRPLPPRRGPAIPMSSAGAAPLGGADGGGFNLTLLLLPLLLALVDSARRVARDAAPPVVRDRDQRRKRPG